MSTHESGRDIVRNLNVDVWDQLTRNEMRTSKSHILLLKIGLAEFFEAIICLHQALMFIANPVTHQPFA